MKEPDARSPKKSEGRLRLTDIEAHVLAQIETHQPTTAYEVMAILTRSPVTNLSQSPGTFYPLVRRLLERGMLVGETVARASRAKELLRTTDLGREAVVRWLGNVADGDLLPPDPLRSKVLYLHLLTKGEQMAFIVRARRALDLKSEELARCRQEVSGPFVEVTFDGAAAVVELRRKWLEDLLLEVARS